MSDVGPHVDPHVEEYRLLIADVAELIGHSRATSDALARSVGQTVARWHLLSVLSGGPHTVAAAARRLGLARQSVQRVSNDLLAEGLAVSTPDPSDARAPLIELTESGRQLVAELYERSEADRTDLIERAGLSAQRLRSARRTIRALIEQFEHRAGDEHD
jgi:DNA-binding MarR family transcriptional regulator